MFELLIALFLCSAANDSIFCDGFGDSMYISTDRPDNLVWSIDSTHSNAAFVTSSNYLSDGKVAIPTRMTWDVGTQSTSVTVTLTTNFANKIVVPGDQIVFAILCPKTAFSVPANVNVLPTIFTAAHALSFGAIYTVTFNDGSTGVIFFHTLTTSDISTLSGGGTSATLIGMQFTIANLTLASAMWATSGQTFDIGEFWFGTVQQFNLATDPKLALIDPTLNRRSHSNQPWPLFIKPYKQWTFNFTPMSNTRSYISSSAPSFDSVRYSLAAANCALVLPRVYTPGTTTVNNVDLNQLACFGKPDAVGQLSAVKDGPFWTATMTFGQAPP